MKNSCPEKAGVISLAKPKRLKANSIAQALLFSS
jgi:hypothetical protein